MNLEWCNQVGSIKYLFKYINKGPDRITASIVDPTKKKKKQIENNDHDEIGEFYNCRYISACEACWRLFGYDIHYRTPSVERLSFHLEHKQPVVFKPNQHLNQVVSKPTVAASQFLAWMECNKHDEDARKLSYVEFPTKYVWNKSDKIWTKRKTKSKALGRLNHVSPKAGDIYYLRILLNKIKGPTCYEDIKTINGIVHDSYKDACYALGLLDDDREYISSINETHHWATASFCRSLFVMLITSDSLSSPAHVFEETYQCLSDDVIHVREQEIGVRGLKLKEDAIFNLTLSYIEKSLLSCGLSLKQIPNMPFPDHRYIQESCNMLIQDELNYDPAIIEVEHQDLYSKLNVDQKNVYHTIMNAVNNKQERQFLPSSGSNNHGINWLPHTCTILASSLCGLLLVESYDPDEYVSKILFVIKPTTSDAKWIPFPTSEYTATKFALVVISSNPLHFKVIRLSYTKPSDMPKEKVDYDYYNIELFSSTTWQWREFQNIRLPSSVYPVSDEAVTSGGAVYFLLSNDTILRFDIYSEEHILIFAPSTINELKPYASRLTKFHGKLDISL
ncbi:unnamed protein product [Lactuca virosa]|uniref:Uncharacterized protein n=1 Tax=Lactuca virosa TaxID=75947 RepID=A0AAU9P547_9ASTR|nr:unnamed protein product [Lactuca virosa]